jgi:PAS domain-containing protein
MNTEEPSRPADPRSTPRPPATGIADSGHLVHFYEADEPFLDAVSRFVGHFETERRTKDGGRRQISPTVSPILDAEGRVIAVSKVARDITERKRAEAALRDSEERFRLLAETVPSIIWTCAPDGTITHANDRWSRYTGLTPEQNAKPVEAAELAAVVANLARGGESR